MRQRVVRFMLIFLSSSVAVSRRESKQAQAKSIESYAKERTMRSILAAHTTIVNEL